MRDLITSFAICNNVTPVVDDPELAKALDVQNQGDYKRGRGTFAASSYNRSALIDAAEAENRSPMRGTFMPRNLNSDQRPSGRNRQSGQKMILQASSPDEVALVKYSNSIKMELVERDRTFVQLRNCEGNLESYDILANFPFSSQTKKMSVLVRQRDTGKIIYYVKGAEIVMESLMKQNQRALLLEFCE